MYLTALTLYLLLLPLGAPQLTGTSDIAENLSKSSQGCVNESEFEDLLKQSQEDIQTELDQLKDELKQAQNELKQAQNQLKQGQDELKQGQLQHSQQEEMHFQQINDLLTQILTPKGSFHNPAPSCKSVSQNSPSGKYWIQSTATVNVSHEYCDMSNTRCGTRGWMRVANLDMSDTEQNCPAGFRYTSGLGYRGCGTHGRSCVSTTFPVHGVQYSKVCGRVNAYQYFTTDAFLAYYNNRALTIDSNYVDGVSLTHGQYPRKHIWTFAAAVDETQSGSSVCPCTKNIYTGVVPPFIGQDYFCETGSRYHFASRVYTEDPLWDGRGCGTSSSCCKNPPDPWFCKTLPQPTTDDIELRLCIDEALINEDVILKLAEIYIQ